MNTILVLTDFSDSALNAARYAVGLAGTFDNCRIILYHSFPVVTGDSLVFDHRDTFAFREESLKQLRDLKTLLTPLATSGTKIEYMTDSSLLTEGAEMITRIESVYLVIAGSKTHSIAERLIFGNNTVDLINKLSAPLMVIPADADYKQIERAVFACDLNTVENIPVGYVRSMINHLGCHLYIVNIDPHKQDKLNINKIAQQEKLHALIDDGKPEYHYKNHPDIEEGIREFTEENQADLLIVIHKKHSFFYNLFQGGTTKKVAMHASVPLLVLKEKAEN